MPQVKLILIVAFLLFGWRMALNGRRVARDGAQASRLLPGQRAVKYLALGDSYTIGESVDPADRYPEQVKRLLAENDQVACGDPEIIAVTGWTTNDLQEALSAQKPTGAASGSGQPAAAYDMVSLLIGVNNQYQGRSQEEYREQFGQLLQHCIRLAGNRPARVVVLSIPDYSVTPFARMRDTALIAAQIDSFNRINSELARAYKVHYVEVTTESRKAAADASLIAADGLHFSGKEYGVWAGLMEPVMKEMLRK